MLRMITAMTGLLTFLVTGPAELAAHGEATLKSSGESVPVGQSMTLNGEGFQPGEAHRLVLRGTLDDYELGTVTAGSDSTFSVEVPIPAAARPGQYRIVALAPDGDEVATLDLAVLAAGEPASVEDDRHRESAARADEIEIQRSRAGAEWGVIGLLIGFAGGLGTALLRRS